MGKSAQITQLCNSDTKFAGQARSRLTSSYKTAEISCSDLWNRNCDEVCRESGSRRIASHSLDTSTVDCGGLYPCQKNRHAWPTDPINCPHAIYTIVFDPLDLDPTLPSSRIRSKMHSRPGWVSCTKRTCTMASNVPGSTRTRSAKCCSSFATAETLTFDDKAEARESYRLIGTRSRESESDKTTPSKWVRPSPRPIQLVLDDPGALLISSPTSCPLSSRYRIKWAICTRT